MYIYVYICTTASVSLLESSLAQLISSKDPKGSGVVSAAYRLSLLFFIDRVFNVTKLRNKLTSKRTNNTAT